jgi:hypothetical protein
MNRLLQAAFALVLLSAFGCKNCQKTAVKETEEAQKEEINNFPKLNLTNLNNKEQKSFISMLNEEVCPCGCPNTFAQCINQNGCKPGELLAQWTIDRLKEGAPDHLLYKAVTTEIPAFLSEPKIIDTKNAYQKGNKNALVTIVEFADFECPMCKHASMQMSEFAKKYPEVQIYFMHFPLSIHANAERAAIVAEAAGKQGKFWDMHDLMFSFNGPLNDQNIKTLAQKLFNKKELIKFEKDLKDPNIKKKIDEHKNYAVNNLKLLGTPTFLFNGRSYNLSSSLDGYEIRLAMEKARKDMNCDNK